MSALVCVKNIYIGFQQTILAGKESAMSAALYINCLLLIHSFMYLTLFVGVLGWSLLCYALLCVLSSFENHLDEEERAGCFALTIFLMACYR